MLDLAKIKAFTTPKETKRYFIAGEYQDVVLSVIPDNVMLQISMMDQDSDKIEIINIALQYILNISKDDVNMILSKDFSAAMKIFLDGKKLSVEWAEKRAEEREKAEKNLKAVQMNTPN